MEIKKPMWSECVFTHGSSLQPQKAGRPFDWQVEIKTGLHILARYGDSHIHMEIIEVKKDDSILARIKYFEPINVPKPKDLSEGDCVQIDRKHICYFFPE